MNTKIVATIGPASDSEAMLRELILAGVNVARLNFSHGNHAEQRERIRKIRLAAQLAKKNVTIMLDTKGPEIRTGNLEHNLEIRAGSEYIFCPPEQQEKATDIPITYTQIATTMEIGDRLLVDDGSLAFVVTGKTLRAIRCRAENSGIMQRGKSVNLPGKKVDLPPLTPGDKEDILFGIKEGVDFIAASFVRNADHMQEIKDFLAAHGGDIPVIAKIENLCGVEAKAEILAIADGLMVARGDLGAEIPLAQVPAVQKELIALGNSQSKPVITATQMLESMTQNLRPTRAEVTDIANAILDGTDAIMLSAETAIGKYPLAAVKTMAEVALAAEAILDHRRFWREEIIPPTLYGTIGKAAVALSEKLEAKAIIIPTLGGETARVVARCRPRVPMFVTSPVEKTCRTLTLTWGITCHLQRQSQNYEEITLEALAIAKAKGMVKSGDLAIITTGFTWGATAKTNSLIAIEVA